MEMNDFEQLKKLLFLSLEKGWIGILSVVLFFFSSFALWIIPRKLLERSNQRKKVEADLVEQLKNKTESVVSEKNWNEAEVKIKEFVEKK